MRKTTPEPRHSSEDAAVVGRWVVHRQATNALLDELKEKLAREGKLNTETLDKLRQRLLAWHIHFDVDGQFTFTMTPFDSGAPQTATGKWKHQGSKYVMTLPDGDSVDVVVGDRGLELRFSTEQKRDIGIDRLPFLRR